MSVRLNIQGLKCRTSKLKQDLTVTSIRGQLRIQIMKAKSMILYYQFSQTMLRLNPTLLILTWHPNVFQTRSQYQLLTSFVVDHCTRLLKNDLSQCYFFLSVGLLLSVAVYSPVTLPFPKENELTMKTKVYAKQEKIVCTPQFQHKSMKKSVTFLQPFADQKEDIKISFIIILDHLLQCKETSILAQQSRQKYIYLLYINMASPIVPATLLRTFRTQT